MTYYICETCGVQLDDSKEHPSACPIVTVQSLPLAVHLVVGISKSEALFLNGAMAVKRLKKRKIKRIVTKSIAKAL